MIKRNSSEHYNIKLPIRTPRSTKNTLNGSTYQHILLQKFLQLNNNAVYFWKVQEHIRNKIRSRELAYLISSRQYVAKYMNFTEIKTKIKDVITQRVEKDYLFGTTFNTQFRILQKYARGQRKLKQKNFFNRYYFSSCPPKISLISQPTITTQYTVKVPETSSTIELKALTRNLEIMLKTQKKQRPALSGEKQRRNQKNQKTIKRRIKSPEQIPEENYGLKSYKKTGKAKSKGKVQLSKVKVSITPQPHGNLSSVRQSPQGIHQRLSERWSSSNKSRSRKNEKVSVKKIF